MKRQRIVHRIRRLNDQRTECVAAGLVALAVKDDERIKTTAVRLTQLNNQIKRNERKLRVA